MSQIRYQSNQAFERAYEYCKRENPDHNSLEWHNRYIKFHNLPNKIAEIPPYVMFVTWFNELFEIGQKLITELLEINHRMENTKTNWLGIFKKRKINQTFNELQDFGNNLNAFKADCAEYQRCILATEIGGNHDFAEALYEQTRYIDNIESKIRQTGERKITGIDNTRMQVIGLVLSLTAIIVSILSFKK